MKNEKNDMNPATSTSGMRVVNKGETLSRRGFLKSSSLASIGVTVVSGAAVVGVDTEALAAGFPVLGEANGKVLLKMARDIFPHDKLADKYYLMAIEPYDEKAKKDAALKKSLLDGVAQLNDASMKQFKKNYIDIKNEADRVAVLKSLETSEFFQKIRGDMVTGLYNNKAVWSFFGYEGSSWEKGGYVNRGFNDLDWL